MNNNKNLSPGWAILPLLFCSVAVLAGDGGYDAPYGQIPAPPAGSPIEEAPARITPPAPRNVPDAMGQAQALGQEEDGFLDDASETSSLNTGYVGGNTRIGIGVDTELKGKAEASQVLHESAGSATIGQGYVGFNPNADKDLGEETLTGAGAKLNHHWVSEGNDSAYVNKIFGAYDQNEQKDKKVTLGYGQENADLFWSGHVSKGLSDSRPSGTAGVMEKAYDYGVGGRVGSFLTGQQMRIQGGLDYEWGEDFAATEKRPTQATLTGGVEKFFPDTPHSIGADLEVYKKSGGFVDGEEKAEARGGISYRYDIGSEAGVWQPEHRYRRVRTEIPGQDIKQPPKVERKLVKNTMELESDTFFKVDSAKLTPEAQERMQAVVAQMRKCGPEGNIRITGNTCDVGSTQHNQKLSERRANSVRDFLVKSGFPANTLIAQGLGESSPKYPNTDAERHKNRRVDVEYVCYETQYKDEVVEQGGTSRTDPKVVWRKELIPEPPLWVRQALRNVADHKQTVDTYKTTAGATSPNAPTANNDAVTTTVGTPVTIDVLANDTDPNGDVLTIVSFNQGNNGSVTQVGNGLVYTPVAGFTGTDTFTYVITDPAGNQSTATVTVTVAGTGANTPVAGNDAVSTPSNTPVSINVLANDTDPNGDPLTIASFTQGGNGTVTRVGNNLVYTPAAGFTGTDTFTYTVTDPAGNQSTATVTVTVTAVNPNVPVANNDTAATTSGTPVTVDVLANDTDPNGGTLSIASFGLGGNGTVTQVGNNLVYTPAAGFTGTDTFTYTVTDPDGNLNTATVTVTVTAAGVDPNAPVANADTATTTSGAPVTVNVLANDTDPNSDALTIASFGQGGNGTVTQVGSNLVYTPAAGFTGTDTFTYTVTDPAGNTATGTVTVTVTGAVDPNAPAASSDSVATSAGTPATIRVMDNDTDPDGGALSISGFSQGANGTVTQDGSALVYTPATGFTGDDSFTYTITDTAGNAATATVYVLVTAAGGGLSAADDSYAIDANSPATSLGILANDAVPAGAVIISIVTAPAHGSVDVIGNHVEYTPDAGYTGGDSFTYRVTDSAGSQATATVDLSVGTCTSCTTLSATHDYLLIDLNDTATRTLTVLDNDSGDEMEIVAVSVPRYGTAVISPDGKSIRFTLRSGYCTDHTFTYTVKDKHGNQTQAAVVVDISPANIDPNSPPG